jgi:micrococcal nuclease
MERRLIGLPQRGLKHRSGADHRVLVTTTAPAMKVVALALFIVLAAASGASATHVGDVDCGDFSSQAAAQYHMNAHPGDPDGLDGNDHDGRACESNPCPCYYGTATAPEPTYALPAPSPSPTPQVTPEPTAAKTYRGRIARVVDGDTLKVRLRSGSLKTVRLIGIDTPETRKPGVAVECGGKTASRYMNKLAFRKRRGRKVGRLVRLTTDPTQHRTDSYGRLLAYVDRTDGRDLAAAMIRAGWAMAYVYDGVPFRRFASYDRLQTRAKTGARGVWRSCGGDFHSAQ